MSARVRSLLRAATFRVRPRRALIRVGLLASFLAVLVLVVVASGIVPVKASSGHWKVTDLFLHFAMQRSVATHSLAVAEPPRLDDPALIMLGASHYELGCRPCHGLPETEMPRIPQRMTPAPPLLPPTLSHWKPRELFYIVMHGVKFTGMPAWPAPERDDEVWAVVSFLLAFPGMSMDEYRRLALAEREEGSLVQNAASAAGVTAQADATVPLDDAAAGVQPPAVREVQAIVASCAHCHGDDGAGRSNLVPSIAAQRERYLRNALVAYARNERSSGIMEPVAAALNAAQIEQLARHYASLPARPGAGSGRDVRSRFRRSIERGRRIAEQGIARERVPACSECHEPQGRRSNPAYPRLAGQHARYLVAQLELLQSDRRGGSRFVRLMRPVASRLTIRQARDVARYYESIETH